MKATETMSQMQIFKIVRFATVTLLGLCSWAVAQAGSATSITGLYFTGVDASGGLLNGGSTDSHWSVTYAYANGVADNATYQGPAYVVSSNNVFVDWAPNTGAAQWITAPGARTAVTGGTVNSGGTYLPGNGTTGNNKGVYVYTLAFNIAGDNVGSAVTNQVSITLTLAADNITKIYVNPILNTNGSINSGSQLGDSLTTGTPWTNTAAITLQNYGTDPNASFVIGTNYLVIEVDNTHSIDGRSNSTSLNPSGLLVYQTGNAILIDGRPVVPEVGTWLPIMGALGLFFWQRRRHQPHPSSPT